MSDVYAGIASAVSNKLGDDSNAAGADEEAGGAPDDKKKGGKDDDADSQISVGGAGGGRVSPGPLPTADAVIKPQGMSDHGTKNSSKSVMSKHAVNLGCYTLNLGTDNGQKVYSMLMIFLPMIPLLILIGRLGTNLAHNKKAEKDLVMCVSLAKFSLTN